MHDEVKRYSLDGEISDESNLVESKSRLVHFIEFQMRDDGYIPLLDMEPQFTLDYNPETETYTFKLSVYGVQAEGDEAWASAGMMYGTMIMRSTPQTK